MTTTATVHSRPAAYGDGQLGAVFLAPSVMHAAGVDVGDFVRIATRRGRSVVGRVAEPNGVDGQSVQFDRFARQALKAFPHEQVSVVRADLQPAKQIILPRPSTSPRVTRSN